MHHPVSLVRDALGRAIVETVRTPLIVLDEELRVITANPAFHSAYRLSEDAVLGRPLLEIANGQWDDPVLKDLLVRVLPARSEIHDLEVRARLEGLGRRVMIVNARQVRLEGEGRDLILLSLEDVTRREALESALRERTREMERSNRDLEEFAHAASHDLQEPLRKIRTYAERIAAGVDPEALGERERLYLSRMSGAVERMQWRIDDILQLARVGRGAPSREPVALGEILATVLEDLEPSIEAAGAKIEMDALPTIEADPAQVRMLFQNLLSNAIKFRREGESPTVRITAETEPDPDGTAGGVTHLIGVEDDGIGFDPQYATRIFRPFERLHGRESFEGTGIGLPICRRIMEHHHGTIVAEGRPGEGARFILTFPPPTGSQEEGDA